MRPSEGGGEEHLDASDSVSSVASGTAKGEFEVPSSRKGQGSFFDPRAIMEECLHIARKRSYASVGGA